MAEEKSSPYNIGWRYDLFSYDEYEHGIDHGLVVAILDKFNKGDYDGDTASIRAIYTVEANKELDKVMKEKYNFINSGNRPVRGIGNECYYALYSLTASISDDDKKYTPSKEIVFA